MLPFKEKVKFSSLYPKGSPNGLNQGTLLANLWVNILFLFQVYVIFDWWIGTPFSIKNQFFPSFFAVIRIWPVFLKWMFFLEIQFDPTESVFLIVSDGNFNLCIGWCFFQIINEIIEQMTECHNNTNLNER